MIEPLFRDADFYEFQVEDISRSYIATQEHGLQGHMVCWDTGTGKSIFAIQTACLMFEDDLIDHVLVVAEKNKIGDDEWVGDFRRFSTLSVLRHHGTGRMQRLDKQGMPQVLVTTYETGKTDLCKVVGKNRNKSRIDGPLMERLRGKRVAIFFDESTKVANRTSENFKSWQRTVNHLRKEHPQTKVYGLTATPIERDWENAFNQLLLVGPAGMPSVGEFERRFVRGRDPYDRPRYYGEDVMREFAALTRPYILRRRKSDPEVKDFFPKMVEESRWITMGDDQANLYDLVEDIVEEAAENEEPTPGAWTILRQIVNHPASVVLSAKHGRSQLARALVEELGEDYFHKISCRKQDELVNYLTPLVKGQGAKAVVFTFFGQSVLPLLDQTLTGKKFSVFTHHGGMTTAEQERARADFRQCPNPAIFLTSDAGSRGINLPEATYVVEYESALTHANRTQRVNRAHRITSESESVTCMTFFTEMSIEESIANSMMNRNAQSDILLGDEDAGEDFMTADERRAALRIRRTRRRRK